MINDDMMKNVAVGGKVIGIDFETTYPICTDAGYTEKAIEGRLPMLLVSRQVGDFSLASDGMVRVGTSGYGFIHNIILVGGTWVPEDPCHGTILVRTATGTSGKLAPLYDRIVVVNGLGRPADTIVKGADRVRGRFGMLGVTEGLIITIPGKELDCDLVVTCSRPADGVGAYMSLGADESALTGAAITGAGIIVPFILADYGMSGPLGRIHGRTGICLSAGMPMGEKPMIVVRGDDSMPDAMVGFTKEDVEKQVKQLAYVREAYEHPVVTISGPVDSWAAAVTLSCNNPNRSANRVIMARADGIACTISPLSTIEPADIVSQAKPDARVMVTPVMPIYELFHHDARMKLAAAGEASGVFGTHPVLLSDATMVIDDAIARAGAAACEMSPARSAVMDASGTYERFQLVLPTDIDVYDAGKVNPAGKEIVRWRNLEIVDFGGACSIGTDVAISHDADLCLARCASAVDFSTVENMRKSGAAIAAKGILAG